MFCSYWMLIFFTTRPQYICRKTFHGSKNVQMAAMERPVSIMMFFSLLLKLHYIEEVCGLPKWDSLFIQNTLFHQLSMDMKNMHGEGDKGMSWSLPSLHKVTFEQQLVSLDLKWVAINEWCQSLN